MTSFVSAQTSSSITRTRFSNAPRHCWSAPAAFLCIPARSSGLSRMNCVCLKTNHPSGVLAATSCRSLVKPYEFSCRTKLLKLLCPEHTAISDQLTNDRCALTEILGQDVLRKSLLLLHNERKACTNEFEAQSSHNLGKWEAKRNSADSRAL